MKAALITIILVSIAIVSTQGRGYYGYHGREGAGLRGSYEYGRADETGIRGGYTSFFPGYGRNARGYPYAPYRGYVRGALSAPAPARTIPYNRALEGIYPMLYPKMVFRF